MSYGRNQFIKHMNEKAKAIGMTHTTFVDPTGVSEGNISTAEDIFMLAKYIYNNRSFIFNITSGKVKTNTYGKSIFSDLGTGNSLSDNESFFGGISDEKDLNNQSNLSVLEVKNGSNIRPIFFVSLISKNAKSDILNGLDYLLTRYK
jgi:D-alanyl-D-alanine endopeptidase (penicillin-binding protein 7)